MIKNMLITLVAFLSFQGFVFAQANADAKLNQFYPQDYNAWTANSTGSIASGSGVTVTVNPTTARVTASGRGQFNPFVINGTLLIDKGVSGAEETVTITAATCTPPTSCTFAATFSNAHTGRFTINSGSYGVNEALAAAVAAGGGSVWVGPSTAGNITTAMLTGAANGSASAFIVDRRTGGNTIYQFTGSAYVGSAIATSPTNGSFMQVLSKTTTVNGSAAATISASNFIPAGSLVLGLTSYVTSTFSNASLTSMKIGDGTTTNKFSSATMALTAGTVSDSLADGANTTPPIYNAATSVVITGNGANFAANGTIRLVLYYVDLVPPTN
jgi:hypothetical protein